MGSVLPEVSVARTRHACAPMARSTYEAGDAQAPQSAWSSEHSNVAPASVALNSNVAEVDVVVPDGPETIVVPGGLSTVTLAEPDVATLPARSVARAATRTVPSGSDEESHDA